MRIRAIEPEDLELLYTIENDTSLWWLSSQTAPLSRYHLRQYVASNEADIYKDGQVRYVIEIMSATGQPAPAGLIDLFNFSPQHRRAELGIVILREYCGRGIAQQAVSEIIKLSRQVLNLHQLYAVVPADNEASISMLRKAQFRQSAVLPDWLFYASEYHDACVMQLFCKKLDEKVGGFKKK